MSDRQACTWWASCCSGRRRRAAVTRCVPGQDPQPELQRTIGAASIVPAAPPPYLVDVLLEAVSDRQACT
ncbi:hypothetical protein DNF23_50265 [Pseudomonas syringae pv. pisi]